eukprot:3614493-Pleurochrysis_carterae.AAC.2
MSKGPRRGQQLSRAEMVKGTYVPNYSTGHVDMHSRHACARDGNATERGGGRDVPPTHHPP